MKKMILTFLALTTITGVVLGGAGTYSKTVFYNDVSVGTWQAVSGVSAARSTGGTYTNGAYTNYWRVNGTNLQGRLPVSGVVTSSWVGSTNLSNSVVVSWFPLDGVIKYIVERSADGITWTNWTTVSPLLTNYTDYGTNAWTTTMFTNLFSIIGTPTTPWSETGTVATLQTDFTSHTGTVGAAVHGLGSASTNATGDFATAAEGVAGTNALAIAQSTYTWSTNWDNTWTSWLNTNGLMLTTTWTNWLDTNNYLRANGSAFSLTNFPQNLVQTNAASVIIGGWKLNYSGPNISQLQPTKTTAYFNDSDGQSVLIHSPTVRSLVNTAGVVVASFEDVLRCGPNNGTDMWIYAYGTNEAALRAAGDQASADALTLTFYSGICVTGNATCAFGSPNGRYALMGVTNGYSWWRGTNNIGNAFVIYYDTSEVEYLLGPTNIPPLDLGTSPAWNTTTDLTNAIGTYFASFPDADGVPCVISNSALVVPNSPAGIAGAAGVTNNQNNVTLAGTFTPTNHVIANGSNTVDLGSAAMPFRDLYLGSNSLYVAGQKALGVDSSGNVSLSTNVVVATVPGSTSSPINVAYLLAEGYMTNVTPDQIAGVGAITGRQASVSFGTNIYLAGSVGIGVTNNDMGQLVIQQSADGVSKGLRVQEYANSTNYIEIYEDGTNGAVLRASAGAGTERYDLTMQGKALHWQTYYLSAWGDRVTVLQNGNVGIGTTNPTTPLHVVGNMTVSGNVIGGNVVTNGGATVNGSPITNGAAITITAGGGFSFPTPITTATNYALSITQSNLLLICDSTGTVSVTLPTLTTLSYWKTEIVKANTGTLIVTNSTARFRDSGYGGCVYNDQTNETWGVLTLLATSTTNWVVPGFSGTWTTAP